eukprot:TRINITY_DN22566_c0_g1_i4.p2 TRINITY_DN22566_c0_g1~~TRINITY_DN22566_c0_g1_i4.p2  ORF type:complete len:119 (+),score=30.00 TRINITY_DN22566_c0_g1_i4:112-468(+)
MIRRPPRSPLSSSSAASDVYKRQIQECLTACVNQEVLPEDGVRFMAEYLAKQAGISLNGDETAPVPSVVAGSLGAALTPTPVAQGVTSHPASENGALSARHYASAVMNTYSYLSASKQ